MLAGNSLGISQSTGGITKHTDFYRVVAWYMEYVILGMTSKKQQ